MSPLAFDGFATTESAPCSTPASPTGTYSLPSHPVNFRSAGKQLKILNVVDIFTRECLTIKTERSITADNVAAVLDELAGEYGVPAYLRMDTSSLLMRSGIGVDSIVRRRRSSTQARPGRTVTSSRSTHDCATSS